VTPKHGVRADLALIVVSLIWGATFIVVKEALRDSSTLLFLALRFTLATVALAAVFRPLGGKFGKGVLLGGGLAGLLLFGAYAFQTFGLRYTSASKSAFLTGLFVVMVPLFGAPVARKLPSLSEILGVIVATVGMGLMTLKGASLRIELGDLLTLACAATYAIHILVLGHLAPRLSFQGLALTQVATAAALSLATFWWAEPPSIRWTPQLLAAVAVTGLLATAFAFSVQTWAQRHTTPTRTAIIFALEPVFAWLTSFLVAGEVLSPRAAIGALLILAGMLTVELKPLNRVQSAAPIEST
jgi:drug/metabolite transporter (DMT)-like permease